MRRTIIVSIAALGAVAGCGGEAGQASDPYATATTTVGEQPDGRADTSYVGGEFATLAQLIDQTVVIDGTITDVSRGPVGGPPDDLTQGRVLTVTVNEVLAGAIDEATVQVGDGTYNAGPEFFGSYSVDGARFGQPGERAILFLSGPTEDGSYFAHRPQTRFFVNRGRLVRGAPDDGNPVIAEIMRMTAAELAEHVRSESSRNASSPGSGPPTSG